MQLLHSDLYLGFIAAALALIAMPGPNTTLIVGNTISYGTLRGLTTLAGTSSALIIQLIVIILGLTETAEALSTWFDRLRWVGVAYLVYLGLREWIAKGSDAGQAETARTTRLRQFYAQGFMVCIVNPKTLAFFAAFLPQFVEPANPMLPQLAVLGATFMVLAIPGDAGFCLVASRIRPYIVGPRYAQLRHRISGTCLLICALGLALAHRG